MKNRLSDGQLEKRLSETQNKISFLQKFADGRISFEYLEKILAEHKYEDQLFLEKIKPLSSQNHKEKLLISSIQDAGNQLILLVQKKINEEREYYEPGLLDDDKVKQNEFAQAVNDQYLSIKDRQDVLAIVENFLLELPESIFLYAEKFTGFEALLVQSAPVGRNLPFSYPAKGSFLRNDNQDTKKFILGDFSHFIRLLGKKIDFETETDCKFTALRLLQVGIVSHYAKVFAEKCAGIFKNINELSLVESLFLYYKKCGDVLGDIFQDPAIMLFAYFLIENRKFGEVDNLDYFNVLRRRRELLDLLKANEEEFKFRLFEEKMTRKAAKSNAVTMQDIDLMTGEDFEHFVAKIFTNMGYRADVTQLSGDYGVDVIAEQNGVKIGIQAKRYSGSVSNSAIQEIVAGMSYHECQKGVVVTNSTFTKAAVRLAEANNIQLWDRKALEEKILEVFAE